MIRYDTTWHDMIWYDMIWYMIWYDVIWYMIWYDVMWCDVMWCDMIWYDMIWYMIWYDIWYDMIWYMIWYDIFVNCNWVATRWQLYSTHLHTNNTQNDTKQKIHRTTQNLSTTQNLRTIQKVWKRKFQFCNGYVYLNQECLWNYITPKFLKIKTPKTSLAANRTHNKIHILRIKNGIKLLCATKIVVVLEWNCCMSLNI
jgi:hypothetical protein